MSVSDSGGGQVTGPRLQHVVLYCSMVLRTLTEKLSPDETRCKHFITEKGLQNMCLFLLINLSVRLFHVVRFIPFSLSLCTDTPVLSPLSFGQRYIVLMCFEFQLHSCEHLFWCVFLAVQTKECHCVVYTNKC